MNCSNLLKRAFSLCDENFIFITFTLNSMLICKISIFLSYLLVFLMPTARNTDLLLQENRWRKQGISLTPMRFALGLFGNFHVLVSIYQSDGSVSITHGGIEMGQGINTKAAQVCAYKFEIDVEMVKIKPSNVLTAPNDFGSVNSMTSDSVCQVRTNYI